jgi:hypothetical protein
MKRGYLLLLLLYSSGILAISSIVSLDVPANIKITKAVSSHQKLLILEQNGLILVWTAFDGKKLTRINLPNNDTAVDLCCGRDHCAVITESGSLYTWGKNEHGELGMEDYSARDEPTLVNTKNETARVSCGDFNTIIIDAIGKIYVTGQFRNTIQNNKFQPYEANRQFFDIASKERYIAAIPRDNPSSIIIWGDPQFSKDKNWKKELKQNYADHLLSLYASDEQIAGYSYSGKIITWNANGVFVVPHFRFGNSTVAIKNRKIVEIEHGQVACTDQCLPNRLYVDISDQKIVAWRLPIQSKSAQRSIQAISSTEPKCNGLFASNPLACGGSLQGFCGMNNVCSCYPSGLLSSMFLGKGNPYFNDTNCGPVINKVTPQNIWSETGASIVVNATNLLFDPTNLLSSVNQVICRFAEFTDDFIADTGTAIYEPCIVDPTYTSCTCKVTDIPNSIVDRLLFVDLSTDYNANLADQYKHWSLYAFDQQLGNTNSWHTYRFFVIFHNSTGMQRSFSCNIDIDLTVSIPALDVLSSFFPDKNQSDLVLTGQPNPLFSSDMPSTSIIPYGDSGDNQTQLVQFTSTFQGLSTGKRNAMAFIIDNTTGIQLTNNRSAFIEFAFMDEYFSTASFGNILELGVYSFEGHHIFTQLQRNYSNGQYEYSIGLQIYSPTIVEDTEANPPTFFSIMSTTLCNGMNFQLNQPAGGFFHLKLSVQNQTSPDNPTNYYWVIYAQLLDLHETLILCQASKSLTPDLMDTLIYRHFQYFWIGQSVLDSSSGTLAVQLNRVGIYTNISCVTANSKDPPTSIWLWFRKSTNLIILICVSGGVVIGIFIIIIIIVFVCCLYTKKKKKEKLAIEEARVRKKSQIAPSPKTVAPVDLSQAPKLRRDNNDSRLERRERRKGRRKEEEEDFKKFTDETESIFSLVESYHSSDSETDENSDGDYLQKKNAEKVAAPPEKKKEKDVDDDDPFGIRDIDDLSTIDTV